MVFTIEKLYQKLEAYEREAHNEMAKFNANMTNEKFPGFTLDWSASAFWAGAMLEVVREVFDYANHGEIIALREHLIKEVMQHARRGNSRSTSVLANAMEAARAECRSQIFEDIDTLIKHGDYIIDMPVTEES